MSRARQLPHLRHLCLLVITFASSSALAAPVSGYTVIRSLPHATSSYTEGLFFLDGHLYEGTGLNGHSALLVTEPETGTVLQHVDLPPQLFGEGIAAVDSELFQWTWQSHIGFVYDRASLRLLRQFTYTGEGWGMTTDHHILVTSDGTATLRFRDPRTFREVRHIVVHDGSQPIDQLNELEWVHGEIFANLWHTDTIARISPSDGHILGWIDLSGLLPDRDRLNAESVLNGIAFDADHNRLFVTGKQWPSVFEIRLVPKP